MATIGDDLVRPHKSLSNAIYLLPSVRDGGLSSRTRSFGSSGSNRLAWGGLVGFPITTKANNCIHHRTSFSCSYIFHIFHILYIINTCNIS